MSTESDPNQSQPSTPAQQPAGTPANQDAAAKEAAAKAIGQAKEKMTAGVEAFKKLDLQAQIYLAGLTVTVLCSSVFSFYSVSYKMDGAGSEIAKQIARSVSYPSVLQAGANGAFAVFAAAAGIGLWIWNLKAKKKESWAPLAIAGSAALSAILLLVLWLRVGSTLASVAPSGFGLSMSAGMTILGFWLPLAGAIAAAFVSVKPIIKAKTSPPAQ